jgi:Spy/CpxP family protein refolding chaperone
MVFRTQLHPKKLGTTAAVAAAAVVLAAAAVARAAKINAVGVAVAASTHP